ncbi:MAG: type II toxin-antitoxin system Phd/YefM family antitoxin [Gammaproteobacteria bacterium]
MEVVYADASVSITELKKNPSAVIEQAGGFPVAILNHNKPAAYLVPASAFEELMDKLEMWSWPRSSSSVRASPRWRFRWMTCNKLPRKLLRVRDPRSGHPRNPRILHGMRRLVVPSVGLALSGLARRFAPSETVLRSGLPRLTPARDVFEDSF